MYNVIGLILFPLQCLGLHGTPQSIYNYIGIILEFVLIYVRLSVSSYCEPSPIMRRQYDFSDEVASRQVVPFEAIVYPLLH
jgi:hypothetical protein